MTTAKFPRLNVPLLLKSVAAIIILTVLFRTADLAALWQTLKQTHISLFVCALVLEALYVVGESFKTKIISGNKIAFRALLESRLASSAVGQFAPGYVAAEFVRFYHINRHHPGMKWYVLLLLIANRLYGVLGSAIIIILASSFTAAPSLGSLNFELIRTICIIMIASSLVLPSRWVRRYLVPLAMRLKKFKHLPISQLYLATVDFFSLRVWLRGSSLSVLLNVLVIIQYVLVTQALHLSIDPLIWVYVAPLVGLAAFLPLGIGGVGPQDAVLGLAAVALSQPIENFIAVSILIHAIRMASAVVGIPYLFKAIGPFAHSKH